MTVLSTFIIFTTMFNNSVELGFLLDLLINAIRCCYGNPDLAYPILSSETIQQTSQMVYLDEDHQLGILKK
jgi:hypothetical protein